MLSMLRAAKLASYVDPFQLGCLCRQRGVGTKPLSVHLFCVLLYEEN